MKVIGIFPGRCTGCRTCELYCAAERGSAARQLLQAAQESPRPLARVRVEVSPSGPFPLQCRQCADPLCVTACLTGALSREEDQPVLLREDRCIGCFTCTVFCPYGVIFPSRKRKVVLKCDRCLHMELPVCLDVCPTGALVLVESEGLHVLLEKTREEVASRIKFTGVKPFILSSSSITSLRRTE